MVWIKTDRERQVRFSDAEMDDVIEWSDNRTAQTDQETAEYLVETYDSISYADDNEDSEDDITFTETES